MMKLICADGAISFFVFLPVDENDNIGEVSIAILCWSRFVVALIIDDVVLMYTCMVLIIFFSRLFLHRNDATPT